MQGIIVAARGTLDGAVLSFPLSMSSRNLIQVIRLAWEERLVSSTCFSYKE